MSNINDEFHLFSCPSFANQQRCLFGKVGSIINNFHDLNFENKVKTLLCPNNLILGKIVNKYIKIIFRSRQKVDEGCPISSLTFPPMLNSFEDDNISESDSSSMSDSESDTSTDQDT